MRAFFATACLAILVVSVGGCRFLSSDDEEAFYFELTFEDVETDGTGSATLEGEVLVIRGEYLHSDGSIRYVELTVPEFDGQQTYELSQADGIYGAIDDDESVQYGYSSGRPEDSVRIDDYDSDRRILLGAFFFYGTAFQAFDGFAASAPFRVAGRFRTALE